MDDRNIVFETHDEVEASIIRSILEGEGIEVFVYKESLSGMYGFFSPTIGKVRLGVRAGDAGRAGEIIRGHAARPEGGEAPGGEQG